MIGASLPGSATIVAAPVTVKLCVLAFQLAALPGASHAGVEPVFSASNDRIGWFEMKLPSQSAATRLPAAGVMAKRIGEAPPPFKSAVNEFFTAVDRLSNTKSL